MKNLKLAYPSEMAPSARAGEITTILAAAIVRATVKNEPRQSEVRLGFSPVNADLKARLFAEVDRSWAR